MKKFRDEFGALMQLSINFNANLSAILVKFCFNIFYWNMTVSFYVLSNGYARIKIQEQGYKSNVFNCIWNRVALSKWYSLAILGN